MSKLVRGALGILLGYAAGAALGYMLIMQLSSNQFDKGLEAVMTAAFGTGPIKGFAVVLCIGIITSVFTGVVVSRAIVNLMYGGRRVERLLV